MSRVSGESSARSLQCGLKHLLSLGPSALCGEVQLGELPHPLWRSNSVLSELSSLHPRTLTRSVGWGRNPFSMDMASKEIAGGARAYSPSGGQGIVCSSGSWN